MALKNCWPGGRCGGKVAPKKRVYDVVFVARFASVVENASAEQTERGQAPLLGIADC